MDTATLDASLILLWQLEVPPSFPHTRTMAPTSWEGVPSEPFTPIEQICHVRDIELAYHDRFERTLNEVDPTLATVDGEALVHERSYDASSSSEVFCDPCSKGKDHSITLLTHPGSSLEPQHLKAMAR